MPVFRASHAWFIFNLNTESHHLQIIHCNIYTLIYCLFQPNPLLPAILCLLIWRTSSFARGGEYPTTLVPGLLTNAQPFASSPTLSHPTDQVTIFTKTTSTTPAVLVWHYLHALNVI
jgi:hypothetical protein